MLNLQTSVSGAPHALSSKMKIIFDPAKPGCLHEKHVGFYMKYSSFVFRALEKPAFQEFLCWMLKTENIEEQMIRDVDVKVFPLRRKSGKGLAGNCDLTRGKIRLYPKTVKFCSIFKQKFGRKTLLAYAGNRARAALIHELLHLKYAEDEEKVRALARNYFFVFTRNHFTSSSRTLCVYAMIFKAEQLKKPP